MSLSASNPSPRQVARRTLTLLALLGWGLTVAQAQMGPPGGGSTPGAGGNGGPGGSRLGAPVEQRQPTLDDLMPHDPWRIWAERLALDNAALAMSPEQQSALDGFVRELTMAAQFNSARLMREVRHRPSTVSASTDIDRDLRLRADDAQDWLSTLADLRHSWRTLQAQLTPAQQSRVEAAYRDSLNIARQGPPLARAGGARPSDLAR